MNIYSDVLAAVVEDAWRCIPLINPISINQLEYSSSQFCAASRVPYIDLSNFPQCASLMIFFGKFYVLLRGNMLS
jgi:hypothetical protein